VSHRRVVRLADHRPFGRTAAPRDDTITGMGGIDNETVWSGALTAFLEHLEAGNASAGTVRLRRHYLLRLAAAVPDLRMLDEDALTAWLAGPSWRPETRKSARASATTFCRWAARRGWLEADPSVDLPTVRIPDAEPRPAPADVVRATFAAADATGDPRDPLLIRLALMCGLRVSEIARVRAGDIEGDELRVAGKGGRSRVVPLPPVLLLALRDRRGYVFPGRHDGHLSAHYVGKRIKSLMPSGWTAHTLRHAAGTAVHEASGGDILVTQKFLGHSKPETTRRYVRTDPGKVSRAALAAAATWSGADAS
jgi:integrase